MVERRRSMDDFRMHFWTRKGKIKKKECSSEAGIFAGVLPRQPLQMPAKSERYYSDPLRQTNIKNRKHERCKTKFERENFLPS